jgi:ABC-type oligopeptide transport system substrate-binding subunit
MRTNKLGLAFVVLLATLCVAGTATAKNHKVKAGGTLNVDLTTDVDYTDPALSYLSTGWELEYATGLKLLNYPDGIGPKTSQLTPEAAAGFPKVSNNGKTYDFTIATGFTKFSDGTPVTAASFKAAFDRIADPKMQSPAGAFMSDVVGSSSSPVSGIKAKGNHLVFTLTKAAPDFLARVAMPFFAAIPTNLAHDPNGVLTPASAGPYYIASRTPNKSILLKRNPYYKGKRPHNANQINYTVGNSTRRTRGAAGATDYDRAAFRRRRADAAKKYGINKGQPGPAAPRHTSRSTPSRHLQEQRAAAGGVNQGDRLAAACAERLPGGKRTD